LLGLAKPPLNQLNVPARRLSARFRFLLKTMQHINGALVAQRIDRAKCIAPKVFHDFHNPSAAKTSQHFGIGVLSAPRDIQRVPM
jgi:hypothetical protein